MFEVWQKSYIAAMMLTIILAAIAFILWRVLSDSPPRKTLVRFMLVFAMVGSIFSAIYIFLFWPLDMMIEASNTIVSETKFSFTAASMAEDSDQINLTIEDENGKTTTITTRISDFEIAETGDFFIVTEYETQAKSYTIVYEEESVYADVFDAFRMRQEIMK